MNAIIGLDNIALNDPETPEKTKGYLEKIGTAAEHLLNLINDILDMSRIESGRMVIKSEEFSFSKLLEYVNTMISGQCQEKGLEYHCRINGQVVQCLKACIRGVFRIGILRRLWGGDVRLCFKKIKEKQHDQIRICRRRKKTHDSPRFVHKKPRGIC